MSESDYHYYSSGPEMKEWHCPRPGCKRIIQAFGQKGLELAAEEHMSKHRSEDKVRQDMIQFEQELRAKPEPAMTGFMRTFALRPYKIHKDINVLYVTRTDLGFLKTRGVKIDDEIELDWRPDGRP